MAAGRENFIFFLCPLDGVRFKMLPPSAIIQIGVGDPAVALPARYQPTAVRLLRIFGLVDDSADGLSHRAAFAGVQGYQARGCHVPP